VQIGHESTATRVIVDPLAAGLRQDEDPADAADRLSDIIERIEKDTMCSWRAGIHRRRNRIRPMSALRGSASSMSSGREQ
jgi:hypothetical protein